jgi:hypothetical protein
MTFPVPGGGGGFPAAAGGVPTFLAGYNFPVPSLARWILRTIEETYAEAGVELPDRRVLTAGSVAVDTPLLAVMFGGLLVGPPGNELSTPMHVESPRSATFNIELWRTEPTIGPSAIIPTEAEESAAAEVVMQDAWLLGEAAGRADQMGVGVIWRVAVNEPQGGMVGAAMAMDIQVP